MHGMGFMVSIRPGDVVETEFQLFVETLYKWHAQHGQNCGEMTVGFIATPDKLENLLTYFMSLIQQEEGLRPLFVQLGQIEAAFITPDGKAQKELKFKIDP